MFRLNSCLVIFECACFSFPLIREGVSQWRWESGKHMPRFGAGCGNRLNSLHYPTQHSRSITHLPSCLCGHRWSLLFLLVFVVGDVVELSTLEYARYLPNTLPCTFSTQRRYAHKDGCLCPCCLSSFYITFLLAASYTILMFCIVSVLISSLQC